MTLTLKTMRYFVTALRYESIAKAAAELNIAASAISAALDQVEAHFDLTLTHRHRARGITPTASGKAIAQKFARLLEDYDAMLLEGADLKRTLSGTLRIGYYAPIAPAFLPTVLQKSGLSSGSVDLHLEACDNETAQAGLLSGTYDVVLFVSDGARPEIEYEPLVTAPAYCLLPARHVLADWQSVTLQQIAQSPLVALNRPFATDYYKQLFVRQGVSPRVVAHATSTEMVRSLVGAGLGCAVLNMVPQTDVTYAGDRVVAVPIADDLPGLSLAVGYAKTAPRRVVECFATACKAYFNDTASGRCIVA